jgi:hypothetical protein
VKHESRAESATTERYHNRFGTQRATSHSKGVQTRGRTFDASNLGIQWPIHSSTKLHTLDSLWPANSAIFGQFFWRENCTVENNAKDYRTTIKTSQKINKADPNQTEFIGSHKCTKPAHSGYKLLQKAVQAFASIG